MGGVSTGRAGRSEGSFAGWSWSCHLTPSGVTLTSTSCCTKLPVISGVQISTPHLLSGALALMKTSTMDPFLDDFIINCFVAGGLACGLRRWRGGVLCKSSWSSRHQTWNNPQNLTNPHLEPSSRLQKLMQGCPGSEWCSLWIFSCNLHMSDATNA